MLLTQRRRSCNFFCHDRHPQTVFWGRIWDDENDGKIKNIGCISIFALELAFSDWKMKFAWSNRNKIFFLQNDFKRLTKTEKKEKIMFACWVHFLWCLRPLRRVKIARRETFDYSSVFNVLSLYGPEIKKIIKIHGFLNHAILFFEKFQRKSFRQIDNFW